MNGWFCSDESCEIRKSDVKTPTMVESQV